VFTILTSREIDVFTGVGRGDSNKEIARRLHLTPETVKWHLKNIMRKMGADTRAEAVSNASVLGLSLSEDG
jgi:LuxR family transcriptional regulator, maltose regulon positive regulatory protein